VPAAAATAIWGSLDHWTTTQNLATILVENLSSRGDTYGI
jgi:hypothetical protein